MKKIEINSGVTLKLLNTSQFKDVIVTVRFLTTVTRKNSICRTILSQMLYDRCSKWPTKQEVSAHMDELYGASVYTRGYNYGQLNAFEFRFKAINEQYTQENTLERLFKTAHEFIFNPLMKEGLLDKALFEEAKSETIMSNIRKFDQPLSKAVAKAGVLFAKGYALEQNQLFSKEEIEAITLEDVSEEWQTMLNQNAVMIFVVGKIDEEKTIKYVERFFEFEPRQSKVASAYLVKKEELEEKEEIMKIDQTILVMVYQTDINIASADYWKLRVANALFGQLPTSLLFQEVREKRSLCYSIGSRALAFEGGVLVSTGIQKSKLIEVMDCINEQVLKLSKGEFNEEDLNTAIVMLKNAIEGAYDDPSSIINFEFQNTILNRNKTATECINDIENTTKEDIMTIFSNFKHVVTFSLIQEEENENAY